MHDAKPDDHVQKTDQAIARGEQTRDEVKALIDRHTAHGQDPQLAKQLLANVEETVEKQRQLRAKLSSPGSE